MNVASIQLAEQVSNLAVVSYTFPNTSFVSLLWMSPSLVQLTSITHPDLLWPSNWSPRLIFLKQKCTCWKPFTGFPLHVAKPNQTKTKNLHMMCGARMAWLHPHLPASPVVTPLQPSNHVSLLLGLQTCKHSPASGSSTCPSLSWSLAPSTLSSLSYHLLTLPGLIWGHFLRNECPDSLI